jgi:hypothetical protein
LDDEIAKTQDEEAAYSSVVREEEEKKMTGEQYVQEMNHKRK